MSQFLYYAPGRHTLSKDDAINAGLRYAFDLPPATRVCTTGPDGSGGILFSSSEKKLAFRPGAEQQWKRLKESDIWCGMWSDDAPKPQDLQRPSLISGEWITDDRGQMWCAPKARRFEEIEGELLWRYNLPTRLTLDDQFRWVHGDVKPRYRRLWDLAMQYEEKYLRAAEQATGRESSVSFDFPEASELCFLSLAVNYRIGPIEFDLLGVYDEPFCFAVLDALIDKRRREEFWKKKLETARAAATTTTDSSCGRSVSKPAARSATCQPSPT